jgi:GDPmannose 4,6-dehydratase
MVKEILITGITGQDGSYLAEHLLEKGCSVTGLVRREILPNIRHLQADVRLIYGDLLDGVSLVEALKKTRPDEVYNLAAQSSARDSWKIPIHTTEINALGAHRLFDAVRQVSPQTKIFQASSSEMFGIAREAPQNEKTPFNPINPYAAAKLCAHNIAGIYCSGYDMFIACGILFNHESPRRGLSFITQKVAYGAACAKLGIKTSTHLNEVGEPIVKEGKIALGNLDTKRDWGFAGDYVRAMWLMLQQEHPENYIIATGETHTIRDLCKLAFCYVGLKWEDYVKIDPRLVRPTETVPFVGDYSKAKQKLGWEPKVKFPELVAMMVDAHLARLK